MINDEDDDDIEFEEWVRLSDAEQEAILAREIELFNKFWNSLSVKQQIAMSRLKIREWRKTRRFPGEA